MVMTVLKRLLLRLGNNGMSYEPISVINTLKTTKNVSYGDFHGKAQEIEDIFYVLKIVSRLTN